MSKERARRRAERERERALAAERRARREERDRRRQAVLESVLGPVREAVPRRTRWARPGGRLAERRRAQNGLVAVVFVAVQILVWLMSGSWGVRVAVLVLSILLVPVLVTLIFDRRS